MTNEEALAFATKHVAVWNSHDLDRILDLYTDDAELTSPLAAAVVGDSVVSGKAQLRSYFERALQKYPQLRFELVDTLRCASSVTLYFKSIHGQMVAEVLFLDPRHKVEKVFAHYAC
jgi:hypothetical protein